MTNEELDEARAKEALQRLVDSGQLYCQEDIAALGARLARENWTPPEPVVDPALLAMRTLLAAAAPELADAYLRGDFDGRMVWAVEVYKAAREQEQERANPVIAFAVRVMAGVFNDLDHAKREARKAIDEYQGEA